MNNKKFNPEFLSENLNEKDLIWTNFVENFPKIFPRGYIYDNEKKKKDSEYDHVYEKNIVEIKWILDKEGSANNKDEIRNVTYESSDLKENERIELEVFRSVKRDPFFTHYMANDLRYFSDRMADGIQ